MSDTEEEEAAFDKEAEKEKLREQLEREEANRRSTRHMSELLLKGATMTNRHCDECGDPIFRYDDREFCPTCSRKGASGSAAADAPGADSAGAAARQPGGADEGAAGVDRVGSGATAEASGSETVEVSGAEGATGPEPAHGATGDVGEHVAGARAALARKLAALASRAEATEDVGRSRELLAAAREAAEALAAIEDRRG